MENQRFELNKSAMLMIDMQESFLAEVEPCEADSLIISQAGALEKALKNSIPLVVVNYQNHGPTRELLMQIARSFPDLSLVTKSEHSAFAGTGLDRTLKGKGVSSLILTGLYASQCVKNTAMDAKGLGFSVATSLDLIADYMAHPDSDRSASWYIENSFFKWNFRDIFAPSREYSMENSLEKYGQFQP